MTVNFEEKTYENYFNCELDKKSVIFFPPGQVSEGVLGFDSIALSTNRRLWRMLGHPYWFFHPFEGVELRKIANILERELEETINNIPQMKANVLFQYKRPDFITKSTGKEWSNWNQPYYRYEVYKEQHKLLMYIYKSFASKMLILYASPALQNVNELVGSHMKGEIIKQSNFKRVDELEGHDRNTYTTSGLYSIACSEPKRLENINIIQLFESFDNNINREDNRNFLINFRKQIITLVIENQYFSKGLNGLIESIYEFEKYPLLYSFLIMHSFRQLTSLQWLVIMK